MALIAVLIYTVLLTTAHSQETVTTPQADQPAEEGMLEQSPTDPSLAELAAPIAGCGCSKMYDPVCASNDKSYFNPCQMECDVGANSAIYIKHQGNCVPY